MLKNKIPKKQNDATFQRLETLFEGMCTAWSHQGFIALFYEDMLTRKSRCDKQLAVVNYKLTKAKFLFFLLQFQDPTIVNVFSTKTEHLIMLFVFVAQHLLFKIRNMFL